MTLKGEVIESLIELNRFRKFARALGQVPARRDPPRIGPEDLRRYAQEVDNAFSQVTKAIQALIKRRPRRS